MTSERQEKKVGMRMTVEDILEIAKTEKFLIWDKQTVREAVRMRRELVPVLLEQTKQYYQLLLNPDWEPENDVFYLHFNMFALLGAMRETRAYPILLKYLVLSETQLENAFGPFYERDLVHVLYNTYDGSLEETKALIADTRVDERVRIALTKMLGSLCQNGRLTRNRLVQLLKEVLRKEQNQNSEAFVECVLEIVDTLRLHELCLQVRDLMNGGAMFHRDYEKLVDALFDCEDAQKMKWFPINYEKSEDISETNGPSAQERAILGWSVARNDPCPCGSGKKFKKCCGPKQDALRMQYPDYKGQSGSQAEQNQNSELAPVYYPPIEHAGDRPGLADYFPREGIAVDLYAYRRMTVLTRPTEVEWVSRTVMFNARDQLWKAYEEFIRICAEKKITTEEFDRAYAVHYRVDVWMNRLVEVMMTCKDSRLPTITMP